MEYKELMDNLDILKIETFINDLWRPVLNMDERKVLDECINDLLNSNLHTNYFLCYINYKMTASGSNQLKIQNNGFVYLKDKFLKILASTVS